MAFKESDILYCGDCGVATLRRGSAQKYCPACSALRDSLRKAKWAKENPEKNRASVETRRGVEEQRKELGAAASAENRASMVWLATADDDFRQAVRVALPFDGRMSKNALWSMSPGRGGHVYMRQEIRNLRDQLANRIRDAGREWFDGKVWIDIFIEKPNARFDAVNMVDFVCDAVKDAIDVDDRWFSIKRLDWSIVKENPRIIIGVSQEVEEDHRGCSYCGRILPLTQFGRNRSASKGHSRACLECGRIVSRNQAKRRRESEDGD